MRCECPKQAYRCARHYSAQIPAKSTEARTKLLSAAHQVAASQQGLVAPTDLGRDQLPTSNPGFAHTVLRETAPLGIPARNVAVVTMTDYASPNTEAAPLGQEGEGVVQDDIFYLDPSNLA